MRGRLFDSRTRSDRSVSVVLGYVLVLGISTILITGLLIAGGNFVEDNRERVIDSEMTVIGNHIAGNMEQVDRLVSAGDDPEVAYINQTFQRSVTGSSYEIEVVDDDRPHLVLRSTDPQVTVHVNTTVQNDVQETTTTGGKISVYYDSDSDELVVDDA